MTLSPSLYLAVAASLLLVQVAHIAHVAHAQAANAPAEVSTTQLYRQIYKELLTFPCVRILNNSHAIGCSSSVPSGTTGILYPVNSQQEVTDFLANTALADADGYILVAPFELLSKPVIDQARASRKVNGMLIVEPTTRQPQAMRSHDVPFPDRSTWVTHDWNPQGTGLLYQDLSGFPIFAVTNTTRDLSSSLADIVTLSQANRQARPGTPLYGAELSSFMSAAHSASDCLRRGFCKPMGGQSVYAPLFTPPPSASDAAANKPVVLLTAALDGKALFQDLAQAASARLAGVAAMLTAVSALGQIPLAERNAWSRRVLVALFNGESWGHIGSRTLAKDLDSFQCRRPFKDGDAPTTACPYIKPACVDPCMLDTSFASLSTPPARIEHILDANVLGGTPDQLRVHTTAPADAPRPFNDSLRTSTHPGIPPSPAVAFLERNPNAQAWVVSTLDSGTYPSTYATEYDDRAALLARAAPGALDGVCAAATALVRATLVLATGTIGPVGPPAVNCTLAAALVDCLTTATGCPLGLDLRSNVPRTSYASVSVFGANPTWPALVAATVLSNASALARGPACKANAECARDTPMCLAGTCVQSPARYHLGWPQGLGLDSVSGKWLVVDAAKPHWVESNWDLTAVRVFARAPRAVQWIELASGVGVTGITALGVWVVRRRLAGLE